MIPHSSNVKRPGMHRGVPYLNLFRGEGNDRCHALVACALNPNIPVHVAFENSTTPVA